MAPPLPADRDFAVAGPHAGLHGRLGVPRRVDEARATAPAGEPAGAAAVVAAAAAAAAGVVVPATAALAERARFVVVAALGPAHRAAGALGAATSTKEAGEVGLARAVAAQEPTTGAAGGCVLRGVAAAAAERFMQRNLPGIASMDCAFRDPALAEHVRMRLRELNQIARPAMPSGK